MMDNKALKNLETVTKEEIQEVRKRLENWGKSSVTMTSLAAHIEKTEKQMKQAEEMKVNGSLDEEEAEKVIAILQMRIDSLADVKAKAFLNEVEMEDYISRLYEPFQSILMMRFNHCRGADFICRKLHISRATFFRKQDRAFREIALMMRE